MSTDPSDGRLSRRSFLIGGALCAVSAVGGISSCNSFQSSNKKSVAGGIIGSNRKVGHMLIEGGGLTPKETKRTGVVIAGGGISGLSSARELRKNGFDDFLLLELEEKPGGNSASGANAVSPYPWGAHYVPLPGEDSVFVRELFEELGVIEGYDKKGLPVYNEYYLCADPQERLLIHGRWQEGLVPQLGISEKDKRQYNEFFGTMNKFRDARGSDGRRAFSIPIDLSSRDMEFLKYDGTSMGRYMFDNGWDSEYLRWYVNYCCRDDYGCHMDEVSAWAGIHYFASRSGKAANADSHAVLTWPEGNGWIVKRMEEKVRDNIRCNACVFNIETAGNDIAVDYYDAKRAVAVRVLSKAVIHAAPRFTAFRTVKYLRDKLPAYSDGFGYAPWMIANVTMKGRPEGKGAPLSWDNVGYGRDSLGYVVANHQDIARHSDKTVLTCYFPLTSAQPVAERQKAIKRSYKEWADMVIRDLSFMHPGIEDSIEELNVWLWGHAMVRPVPGFMWGKARFEAMKPHEKIYFAHSDMSGISIFEEAQYRGIMASRAALDLLHKSPSL
ncbi:MAG: NAD(P)-binding protein [Deltaproteobacteria bacterium]|nr:NAD(P)-binding protein [Deltaproteobacteria bacterium]